MVRICTHFQQPRILNTLPGIHNRLSMGGL
jgi:hypothetical protein